MKKLFSLQITILFISFFAAAQLNAQQKIKVPWSEVSKGKMIKKVPLSNDQFILQVTGKPARTNIQLLFTQDPANAIEGKQSAEDNTFNFDLSDFIGDITTEESGKFFIKNVATGKTIDSFILVRQLIGETPSRRPEKQDEVPVAFYDAQLIYKRWVNKEPFLDVVEKYRFPFDTMDSMAAVKSNPFIQLFLEVNKTIKSKKTTDAATANAALTGILASLSGIDVTKYVQATADFLRDRIKQELAIAFIEKFKNAIDSIPELKALLPKTYNVFNSSDPFKVPSMGQTYRTAFQEDLEGFIANFEIFVDTTHIPRYTPLKTNQVFTAFRIAYHTIDMSANDFHPIDIFDFLDAKFGLDVSVSRNNEINHYVSLLNLLSQHLRKRVLSTSDSTGWIGIEELKKFNPSAILIFWGLVYQQRPDVFNGLTVNGISFKDLLLKNSASTQVYLKQFVVVAGNIDKRIAAFHALIKQIRDNTQAAKELAITDFFANADKLVDITDFIFRLPYFKDELGAAYYASSYYTMWRPIILDVIETTKGVYAKDYGKIAVNATSLFNDISRLHHDSIFSGKFLKNFTFYSNFLVDAINADSANQVKAVLNRYAQPVGSYRVKRKTPFTVSLNAYPGLYFGTERYEGRSNSSFGVTAPLGLSFNLGNVPGNNWSASLFLSAVDIAAALSFRWNNDTLDLPKKITLGQIFSPGAFLVLGFPKVPIAARIGAQYAPQLRTITKDGNTLGEISAWRYGVSVVVDIPIFNF